MREANRTFSNDDPHASLMEPSYFPDREDLRGLGIRCWGGNHGLRYCPGKLAECLCQRRADSNIVAGPVGLY